MFFLTSSVSRSAGRLVGMQFKQVCTAEANVGVQVVLQSEGGFCCAWETVWHSDVHCGFSTLNGLGGSVEVRVRRRTTAMPKPERLGRPAKGFSTVLFP